VVTDVTTTGAAAGTTAWRAVSASRRGSAHKDGVPNQDAVALRRVERPDGDVWVVAVADGHGGARYVRSELGARVAVDVAVEVVSDALAGRADPVTVVREVVPRIVDQWRTRVTTDARQRPFTDAELVRGAGGVTAYGATLLVAVVGEHGVVVAQVGDGDVLVRSHGFATRPVPGDERLVANETTSLCLDTAVDDFRYAVVPDSAEPDLVLLATDGYGNSFAEADWWHGLVDDLAASVARSGFDRVADELPGWLEESARVGGDDVSAVLLVREPLAGEPAAPHPPSRPPRTRELADAAAGASTDVLDDDRRPRRQGLVAVLAAAAAVLGLLVAVFLLAPGSTEEPPADPTTPTTTTSSATPRDGSSTSGGTGKPHRGGTESTKPDRPRKKEDRSANEDKEPPDESAKPLPGRR
jgi:serine/threonine protein phosphatase PrpC